METSSSPPMTPIRQYMSPLETSPRSPTNSYRESLRRRTSSFSSNHDRSPVSTRSNRKRFSNASRYSDDFSPGAGGGGEGMGNLADELDQLEDGEEFEDEGLEGGGDGDLEKQTEEIIDGARDSGIDVSYSSKRSSPRVKNFSKPFGGKMDKAPPDEMEEDDVLSSELEDAMTSIARMTAYTSTSEDPIIPRVIGLLQDLGNQSTLEANTQRLTTSTNSVTSHLTTQTKAMQTLSTTFFSPFAFSAPIDPSLLEDTTPLIEALLKDLPIPDTAPLTGLQKLDRETSNVMQTLSQLTDTLQIFKQATNTASRHLRTTQTMVAELRRERERADAAREDLNKTDWNERIAGRWCAGQCKDVMGGFEEKCNVLRESLVQGHAVAEAAA